MVQRYFIYLSYDGTNFHGWQIQPNGCSVQETLNDSLTTILRRTINVVGAGRTDTGVHARMMVAHFDWEYDENNGALKDNDCAQLCYRLNKILPPTIAVDKIAPVGEDMHARFSAKWRTYHYYIHTNKDPFLRHYSLETHYELDFDAMNKAGEMLTHHKDFAAFCKAGADCKTTLCDLKECRWIKTGDNAWYMTITANRFLRNMVRAVVGTMFLVGRHKISLERFEDILKKENRSDAGESMPGNALFLWEIDY
nr:tRNA pseudouridine(38-40) synthase TruA [Prevotella sp.]